MLQWYRDGLFPIDQLVRAYAFSDINDAFRDSANGTSIKPVLVMDHTSNFKEQVAVVVGI